MDIKFARAQKHVVATQIQQKQQPPSLIPLSGVVVATQMSAKKSNVVLSS